MDDTAEMDAPPEAPPQAIVAAPPPVAAAPPPVAAAPPAPQPTEAVDAIAAKRAGGEAGAREERATQRAMRSLWRLYSSCVLPAEQKAHYAHFDTRPMTEQEFMSRPQVLLIGQYSTGKTSMVKWLTGRDSPHFDVGPQPSTDKFMAVVHGNEERLIRGCAAATLPELPFQGLGEFGAEFFKSFAALALPSRLLEDISLVDTPGVLSGANHKKGRNYDFTKVVQWLADRADLVLLSFDPLKCDMADEFKEILHVLKPMQDKVRCVLNKADTVGATELVRVYGALLWNLGQVLRTPEVTRVFVSSFHEQPYKHQDLSSMFNDDKAKILQELASLPRATLLRKANLVVERARRVRAHFCIMAHIQSKLPLVVRTFRSEARLKRWLSDNWSDLFEGARKEHGLSSGDMPRSEAFLASLTSLDGLASKLPKWDPELVELLDRVTSSDVPSLIESIAGVTAAPLCPTKRPAAASRSDSFIWRAIFGPSPQGDEDPQSKRRRLL